MLRALMLVATLASTRAANVAWTSGLVDTTEAGATPSTLTIRVTTDASLASGSKLVITSGEPIYSGTATTPSCVVTGGGGNVIAASCETEYHALTVTMTQGMDQGAFVITVSDHLGANAASGTVVTFNAMTVNPDGSNNDQISSQTGYTTTDAATSVYWKSAVPSTLVAGTAPSSLELKFTTAAALAIGGAGTGGASDFITITASSAIWTGNVGSATCTVATCDASSCTGVTTAKTATCAITGSGTILTITATEAIGSGHIVVTAGSDFAVNGDATAVTFTVVSTTDTGAQAGGNTGYTTDAAAPVCDASDPNFGWTNNESYYHFVVNCSGVTAAGDYCPGTASDGYYAGWYPAHGTHGIDKVKCDLGKLMCGSTFCCVAFVLLLFLVRALHVYYG